MRRIVLFFAVVVATSCSHPVVVQTTPAPPALTVPASLAAVTEILAAADADYVSAHAERAEAAPGLGSVSTATVVRVTRDVTVYRLWSGPLVLDANGHTSRIGQWWTFDPPTGTQASYRVRYEVCTAWNTLAWVAACTLRRGAVVAVGPGNSVSASTCNDPAGLEAYPANDRDWQVFVNEAYTRVAPGGDLACPDQSQDYEADPDDLAKPRAHDSR